MNQQTIEILKEYMDVLNYYIAGGLIGYVAINFHVNHGTVTRKQVNEVVAKLYDGDELRFILLTSAVIKAQHASLLN